MSTEPIPPEISLDLSSPVPPFERIRARVAALIDAGTLAPGARLPSVRALAADLGIAVGTVARAYRELEGAGYVESRRRHGTTVAGFTPIRSCPSFAVDWGGEHSHPLRGPAGRRAGARGRQGGPHRHRDVQRVRPPAALRPQ